VLTLSSQCERFRTWTLSMRLKEHLYNIAWIFIAHIIGMLLVTHAVLPLQSLAVPNIGTFAALIFPIHGIRVIAAWMFGWWSVPYLFAANVLLALFYAVIAMETPYLEFTAERLMSWSLVSIVAVVATDLFKASGMKIGTGLASISEDTWKQLLFVGFVSSVLNSLGQSLIFAGKIISGEELNVMIGYLIGDTLGTFLCFVGLLFLFRGYRWLTQ
jgi:hypothetical protein